MDQPERVAGIEQAIDAPPELALIVGYPECVDDGLFIYRSTNVVAGIVQLTVVRFDPSP